MGHSTLITGSWSTRSPSAHRPSLASRTSSSVGDGGGPSTQVCGSNRARRSLVHPRHDQGSVAQVASDDLDGLQADPAERRSAPDVVLVLLGVAMATAGELAGHAALRIEQV